MALTSAFFCATLQTGTKIVGWFHVFALILYAAFLTVSAVLLVREDKYDLPVANQWAIFITIYLLLALVLMILASLLYGTYKGRPGFLVPYIAFSSLGIFLSFTLMCYHFIDGKEEWYILLVQVIYLPINIYFVCVVGSHHAELRSNVDRDLKTSA